MCWPLLACRMVLTAWLLAYLAAQNTVGITPAAGGRMHLIPLYAVPSGRCHIIATKYVSSQQEQCHPFGNFWSLKVVRFDERKKLFSNRTRKATTINTTAVADYNSSCSMYHRCWCLLYRFRAAAASVGTSFWPSRTCWHVPSFHAEGEEDTLDSNIVKSFRETIFFNTAMKTNRHGWTDPPTHPVYTYSSYRLSLSILLLLYVVRFFLLLSIPNCRTRSDPSVYLYPYNSDANNIRSQSTLDTGDICASYHIERSTPRNTTSVRGSY